MGREDPEQPESHRKKERRNISSTWRERKQRRQLQRYLPLQWRGRSKAYENIWNSLIKNQVRRGLLHLKSHLKIANSLLAKQFGIIHCQSQNKVVQSLKVSPEIPKGLNCAIRMEIGVNIFNPNEISQENEMLFQREVRLFFKHQAVQEHV